MTSAHVGLFFTSLRSLKQQLERPLTPPWETGQALLVGHSSVVMGGQVRVLLNHQVLELTHNHQLGSWVSTLRMALCVASRGSRAAEGKGTSLR